MVVPIGSSTATSIALPLPSDFHFHRTANLTPLVFMRMRRLCSIRHMSVGVLSILCSMQCISPMRGYDQINMVVVLLLALCTPVNALPPLLRTRDEIIRILFEQGFQYGLILCFLVSVYGICIGCISWPSVGISRQIHVRCAFWEGAGRTVIIIPHKYTVLL